MEAKQMVLDYVKALSKDTALVEEHFDAVFKAYDANGNGKLCREELKTFLLTFADKLK
eukprot:CAMPEP_0202971276 /NCGR_PEP_ID=MMETSP1396-20130829/25550_1 /ASSEMBLY_ACC=CAM_ASM_000872 /TAXON_ID= /ORGANISM="Pseudokeronopsis sp., Strain Brazil" /LENGTH=57 /DNA_ID=CAMNT_0049700499 /DNA_START=81 /DNA_END=254 /DNA_ORIENTATION=+